MSLKTCQRMLMAERVGVAVYCKGKSLIDISSSPGRVKRRRDTGRHRPEYMDLSCQSDMTVLKSVPKKKVSPVLKYRRKSETTEIRHNTRFLDKIPGVGEYNLCKYSDFSLSTPRPRASPAPVMQPEIPTYNTTPVGSYDIPPPANVTRHWSFGKPPGKKVISEGRPIPMEVIFRSSGAFELGAVRHSPAPDTYCLHVPKDKRMGVFSLAKRDKIKKLKDQIQIGPGDYIKDIEFIKTQRAAHLDVVGRLEPQLPFRRKNEQICVRLEKTQHKTLLTQLKNQTWSTASKEAVLFSKTDSGPGFTHGTIHEWFSKNKIKPHKTMQPLSGPQERFALHRIPHMTDRIWGPF